jgi:hypothetical protein
MLAPDRWLKRGWRAFVLNAGAFVGAMLILAIGSAATALLLFIPLGMGLLEMALRARRGEVVSAWDVTRGFRYFAPGLLLWLVGLAAAFTVRAAGHLPIIGAFSGLIGGPLLSLFGILAALCIVDDPGMTVREALGRVLLVVEQNWIGLWAVALLFEFLANVGGMIVGIGWLVTVPWIVCAWAAAYQDLFDRP